MNSFRIIGSTIGEGNAAHVDQWKPYVWNGDPDKAEPPVDPDAPRRLYGSPQKRTDEKAAREAKFRELVLAGATWQQAAQHRDVNVQVKTGRRYWKALPPEVRAKAEQAAAGVEAVKRAGQEAWRIHREQEEAS